VCVCVCVCVRARAFWGLYADVQAPVGKPGEDERVVKDIVTV